MSTMSSILTKHIDRCSVQSLWQDGHTHDGIHTRARPAQMFEFFVRTSISRVAMLRSLVLTFSIISQSSPNLIAIAAAAVFPALRRSETNLPCGPGLTNAADFPPLDAKSGALTSKIAELHIRKKILAFSSQECSRDFSFSNGYLNLEFYLFSRATDTHLTKLKRK